MRADIIRRIISAYDDPIVRAYCWVRFWILRQRFLDEIGQYLPESGPVLDIGCGFGLFSLYYAATAPARFVRGVDLNPRRIAMARRAAARLAIDFTDGRRGQVHVPVAKGHPGNPMTWNDMWRKFEALVAPTLGPHSEALFALVREFGRGGALGEMRAMLRSAGVPPACRPVGSRFGAGGPR